MRLDRAQIGQADGITTIIERRQQGESATAIIKPPRCGKTHIIRVASVEMFRLKLIACTLAVTVNDFLAKQMVDPTDWNEAVALFDLSPGNYRRLTAPPELPLKNGEIFFAQTIQLILANEGVYRDFVSEIMHRTGLPVHVAFDEAHMGSLRNRWGEVLSGLADLGAYLTYFTGSPRRHDDVRIPGLEYVEGPALAPRDYYRVRRHADPSKVWVDQYEIRTRSVEIVGHSTTSLEDAWAANVICHIDRDPLEVTGEVRNGRGVEGYTLSLLEGAEARRALAESVRKPPVIRDVADRMMTQLSRYRALVREVKGIIFCGNDGFDYADEDPDDINRHARDIKKALLRRDPSLDVRIATDADKRGPAVIEAVRAGQGDILIVKNMASLGVSIPALKVGADLSTTRTYAGYMQRMMRCATPYRGLFTCKWITPDDIFSREFWDDIVIRHGGQAHTKTLELVESWETEKKPKPKDDPSMFYPTDTADADFQDSHNNEGRAAEREAVRRVVEAFPQLRAFATDASIAVRLRDAGVTVTPRVDVTGVSNTGITIQRLRDDINHDMQELARRRITYVGYNQDEYQIIITDLWVELYKTLAVAKGTHLEDIEDIELLKRMWSITRRWVLMR